MNENEDNLLRPEPADSATAPRRRKLWLVAAIVVAAVALAATLLMTRGAKQSSLAGRPVPEPSGAPSSSSSASSAGSTGAAPRPGELLVSLEPERLTNAQIQTELAALAEAGAGAEAALRTTGTVQTNAYKEVPVFPIAGGIVREVNAELGDRVKRGQKLATIFSSELADAQAGYLRMNAEIEKHHQHYRRTVELVELGAASREELENATAELKTEQASLASMKQRLILLGMTDKQVETLGTPEQMKPLISVESPGSGVVLTRSVNAGEVVMQGKELFRVADLSSVWVIGQIYEKDFAVVRTGTRAVITTQAYPGRSFNGRVAYIDPRVEPQTRTAQVRVELANPGEMLRLGMFVEVSFGGAAVEHAGHAPAVVVPSAAVQKIGEKQVVFVAGDRPEVFIQREVNAGPESNGRVPIYSGVSAGERVVTKGSFLLRAESLKVNSPGSGHGGHLGHSGLTGQSTAPLSGAAQPQQESSAKQPTGSQEGDSKVQSVRVTLTEKGYQPASFRLRKDIPARVTFVRKVEATCATELLIPDYQIKRDLPFNEPVVVEFTPTKRGESEFSCGMKKMIRGKIVVR